MNYKERKIFNYSILPNYFLVKFINSEYSSYMRDFTFKYVIGIFLTDDYDFSESEIIKIKEQDDLLISLGLCDGEEIYFEYGDIQRENVRNDEKIKDLIIKKLEEKIDKELSNVDKNYLKESSLFLFTELSIEELNKINDIKLYGDKLSFMFNDIELELGNYMMYYGGIEIELDFFAIEDFCEKLR